MPMYCRLSSALLSATSPNCTLSAAGSLSLAPRVFALSADAR